MNQNKDSKGFSMWANKHEANRDFISQDIVNYTQIASTYLNRSSLTQPERQIIFDYLMQGIAVIKKRAESPGEE